MISRAQIELNQQIMEMQVRKNNHKRTDSRRDIVGKAKTDGAKGFKRNGRCGFKI
jgi:hypothetical protein